MAKTVAEPILLTLNEVAAQISLCRRTVLKLVSNGEFPRPLKVTSKSSRWHRDDVSAWIEKKRKSS